MMLIILSTNPHEAIEKLINMTDKRFYWKQLMELCQLLSGCSITNKMSPINRGKEIQKWIKQNPCWVHSYFQHLYLWCCDHINMKSETRLKLYNIQEDLLNYAYNFKLKYGDVPTTTAIFRYKQGYECNYKTNTELPIQEVVNQYTNYIQWKFNKLFNIFKGE